MRWYIIRTLLVKEWQRHLANRGGIALALLLIAAAVLLSVFAPKEAAAGTGAVGGVHHCFVEFDHPSPLIRHLRENVPPDLAGQIVFRQMPDPNRVRSIQNAEVGTGSLQIQQIPAANSPTGRATLVVRIWHPKDDPSALGPYEAWLWRETRRAQAGQLREAGVAVPPEPQIEIDSWVVMEAHRRFQDLVEAARTVPPGAPPLVQDLEVHRDSLGGKVLDFRAAVATGLVVFSLYFACVYLLPTLNCEERERGVLLAQALTPASPTELIAAKFLFYPLFGIMLAATLAAIYKSTVLSSLFFWFALITVGAGFLGIGMTIATLAKTQRAAFLGGMCYLMSVSMVLLICATNNIPFLSNLALEYHGPRILHAALSDTVASYHWVHLLLAVVLAMIWLFAAGWLFRRRGWQ